MINQDTAAVKNSLVISKGRIKNIVGQTAAVEHLERELVLMETKNRPLPFFALYDDTGYGKTFLIKSFCQALPDDVKHVYINCKDDLSKSHPTAELYFDAMRQACNEGVKTIFHLDEIGNKEAVGSFQRWLSAHLSKSQDGADPTFAIYGKDPVVYNPLYVGFILTTFAPVKLAVDIKNRCTQPADLVLGIYSVAELAEITRTTILRECALASVPTPKMTSAALNLLARSMRGNARQAKRLATEIWKTGALQPYSLTIEAAEKLALKVGICCHGLSSDEAKVLAFLETSTRSATAIKAKTGMEAADWQRSLNFLTDGIGRSAPFQLSDKEGEPVPGMHGALVDVQGSKFYLTSHGGRLLALLRAKGFVAPSL